MSYSGDVVGQLIAIIRAKEKPLNPWEVATVSAWRELAGSTVAKGAMA
jgi:hypothetical protein